MKVYIVYKDYGWDNVSKPILVTKSKMQAKIYCKEHDGCEFVEMKLEGGLEVS